MQTFLPYPDYMQSMQCLDKKRLGNQVYRECKTIITGGWPNHPASKMWAGHFRSLANYALYGVIAMQKWYSADVCQRWLKYYKDQAEMHPRSGFPPWIGNDAFHASHKSALLRKDPIWYGQFGWDVPSDLPYVWPV